MLLAQCVNDNYNQYIYLLPFISFLTAGNLYSPSRGLVILVYLLTIYSTQKRKH